MNKLQIRHPDGREQVVETEDAFGALENIFGTRCRDPEQRKQLLDRRGGSFCRSF